MSIDYYKNNAKKFIEDTFNADMSVMYELFEKYLVSKGKILDIGCGSGRDSKYFNDKGYDVYAHDSSEIMVKEAARYIGNQAVKATFEEFKSAELFGKLIKFDGLWACASLIHAKEEDMVSVINNYVSYLEEDGVFFISYKLRENNHEKDGRVFTNYTRERLEKMMGECENLKIIEIVESKDVRDGRDGEGWISVVAGKEAGYR